MSHRDDHVTLQEMLDHTIEAIALADPLSRADLDTQRVIYLAQLQLCQIVDGAATRLSPDLRDAHSRVPWSEIIAFRNRLIHRYDTIDRDILWAILRNDFPTLKTELESIPNQDSTD